MWKGGKPPLIEAISPTVRVSIPRVITAKVPAMTATKIAGTVLVIFGKK